MSESNSSKETSDAAEIVNTIKSAIVVESPSPNEFPPCMEIYEHFLRCAKPRYQVVNFRRHGEFGKCNELFSDWRSCLYVKVVKDSKEREATFKDSFLYKQSINKEINDVFEYKIKPSWDD